MISKTICQKVLEQSMCSGADFAEIYCEDNIASGISMLDGKIENSLTARDKGVGIRIFKGLRCVYAYGNDTSEQGLLDLADKVAAGLGVATKTSVDIILNEKKIVNVHPISIPLADYNNKQKIDAIKEAYFAAKNYSDEIVQVSAGLSDSYKDVLIANSEGLYVKDRRSYIRMRVGSVASDGKENQVGGNAPGAFMGLEFLGKHNWTDLGKDASRQAVTMLHAQDCPAGIMPVIMDNGFGGVIFHEACGHSLEATSVAKNNSVFAGKLGEKIANEKVTAIDDGTIPNKWGSSNIDDEGNKTRKTVLIENGILKNYMIDKLNSRRMNMPATGSGRRQDYSYAPTSRMTNTYIAAGTDKFEDMVASVDNGLYAARMGGGSVNPVTGEFNFAVSEGYLIKNGKIADPVRGATLIGKGADILFDIDMVSNNLSLAEGVCGSSSGGVNTTVGQPAIRIRKITVGGK